jgi:hypothetical protein
MGKMFRWSVPILALGCLGLFRGDVCAMPRKDYSVEKAFLMKGDPRKLKAFFEKHPAAKEDAKIYGDIVANMAAYGASVTEMGDVLGPTKTGSPFQKMKALQDRIAPNQTFEDGLNAIQGLLGTTAGEPLLLSLQATVQALGVNSLDEIPQGTSELCAMLDRSQKIPLEAANAVKTAVGGDVAADVLTNVNTTKDLVGTTADVPLVLFIQSLKDRVDPNQNLEDGLKSIDDLLGKKDRSPSVPFFRAALQALGVNSLDKIPPNDSGEVRDILDLSQMTALDAANQVKAAVGGQEVDVMTDVKSLMLKLAGANGVRTALEGNATSDFFA